MSAEIFCIGKDERTQVHLVGGGGLREAPVVIILPPVAGVDNYVYGVAESLNDLGYRALVIDYYPQGAPDVSTREKAIAASNNINDEKVLNHIGDGIDYIYKNNKADSEPRIAVMGFCVGGCFSLMAAGYFKDRVNCSITFYGPPVYQKLTDKRSKSPVDFLTGGHSPLLANFGENDGLIPLADVDELKKVVAGFGIAEVYVYSGAGHAFHEEHKKERYYPVAAKESWDRATLYLSAFLKK